MYEGFTQRAHKVMLLAWQEARRFHHEHIGTEHILLGLVKEGSGVAANVLSHFGITFLRVREEVEKIIHSGPRVVVRGKRPMTPRARSAIERATEEAGKLEHKHVNPEHLLLGLLGDPESVAAQVLMNLGLADLEVVRRMTRDLMPHGKVTAPRPPPPAQGPEEIARYEGFTQRARKVMLLAEMEAKRFHHEYIGTEHILLGLIQEGSGAGANVLSHFGITFLRIRQEVEKIIQSGPPVVVRGELPLTPRGRRVIEYATEEAGKLDHKHVGTEHLLLGLLREVDGVAAQVLMSLGLTDLDTVRLMTLAVVRHGKVTVPRTPLPAQGPEGEGPNEGIAMLQGFTDRARKVMKLADKEARRFNHEHIGTEHILLGLVKEGSGVAANVLTNLDIDLRKVRREVEKIIQPGPQLVTMWKLPLTPVARKVIEHAAEEAGKLGHKPPGTEHLLLGLLRAQEGMAAQVLRNLGLDLDTVRLMTLQVLGYEKGTVPRAPLPAPAAPPDRIRTLERQLWNLRVLVGAVVGALAGGVLAAQTGAVVGLLIGGVVAGLGRFLPAALAGGITGVLLGSAHLSSEGGGVTGALVGALAGVLLVEVGRPASRWSALRRRCRPPGAAPRAAALRKHGYPMAGMIVQPSSSLGAAPLAGPGPRLWTRDEHYRLANLGFFWNQRVELIEGEIMVLGPQSAEHCTSAYRVSDLLRHHFRADYHVRIQAPLELGASAPEPDVALVSGAWEQYARQHPTSAALIVEVSDSSLDYDRGRKASLYARAGVAEYWIVNLVERRLEVRRGPRPDSSQPFGHGYAEVTTLTPPASVSPLADPQLSLAVADLLP